MESRGKEEKRQGTEEERHVADEKLSLYDALCRMKEEMPGQAISCLSTWYKHINAGDVGVRHGETPFHPNRKPKGPKPHPAMTVPGRLTLDDRLQLAFP